MHTTPGKEFKGEIEVYLDKEGRIFETKIDEGLKRLGFRTQMLSYLFLFGSYLVLLLFGVGPRTIYFIYLGSDQVIWVFGVCWVFGVGPS